MSNEKKAGANTRVTVDNAFSVAIPEGMTYALNTVSDIGFVRLLTILKTEKNEYYRKHSDGPFEIDSPFAAPQSYTFSPKYDMSPEILLITLGMAGSDVNNIKTAKSEPDFKIFYTCPLEGLSAYRFTITNDPLEQTSWSGQIFINDMPEGRERDAVVLNFLKSIKIKDKLENNPEKMVENLKNQKVADIPDRKKTVETTCIQYESLKEDEEKSTDKYKTAIKKWEEDKKAIDAKRRNLTAEKMQKAIKAEIEKISEENAKTIKSLEKKQKNLSMQIKEIQIQIAALGFFKLSQKFRNKKKIEILTAEIEDYNSKIQEAKASLTSLNKEAEDKITAKQDFFVQLAEKSLPYPPEPEKPEHLLREEMRTRELAKKEAEIRKEKIAALDIHILDILNTYGELTASEILTKLNDDYYRLGHVWSALRKLQDNGNVNSTLKYGQCYFY